jgi:hypothetical protein
MDTTPITNNSKPSKVWKIAALTSLILGGLSLIAAIIYIIFASFLFTKLGIILSGSNPSPSDSLGMSLSFSLVIVIPLLLIIGIPLFLAFKTYQKAKYPKTLFIVSSAYLVVLIFMFIFSLLHQH